MTRRGASRHVSCLFFVPFCLQSEGLRGTVGGSPRCVPAGTYFAPPPFKNYNRRHKSFVFTYVCYYDTHICSMFHVPFSHDLCRRMVMLLTFISFFSIKKKNNNFCDFFVVLIFVFNI